MQGASFISNNVIQALKERDALHAAQCEQRCVTQEQREENAAQRVIVPSNAQEKR